MSYFFKYIFIGLLMNSSLVHADWIEEKNSAACISYKWHSFPKDNYAIKKIFTDTPGAANAAVAKLSLEKGH